jgi:hypothetical protein
MALVLTRIDNDQIEITGGDYDRTIDSDFIIKKYPNNVVLNFSDGRRESFKPEDVDTVDNGTDVLTITTTTDLYDGFKTLYSAGK